MAMACRDAPRFESGIHVEAGFQPAWQAEAHLGGRTEEQPVISERKGQAACQKSKKAAD
jgi:hypothetical protein